MRNLFQRPKDLNRSNVSDFSNEGVMGETIYKVKDINGYQQQVALGYLDFSQKDDISSEVAVASLTNFNADSPVEQSQASFVNFSSSTLNYGNYLSHLNNKQILKYMESIPSSEKEKAVAAHLLYHAYCPGPVRPFVDFMADICLDGFKHQALNNSPEAHKAKLWFDQWIRAVKLRRVISQVFSELWICNNSFVWTIDAPYTSKYFRELLVIQETLDTKQDPKFKSKASISLDDDKYYLFNPQTNDFLSSKELSECAHEFAAAKKRWSNKQVPLFITTLNPVFVEIKGGRLPGMRLFDYLIDPDTLNFVANNDNYVNTKYPSEFLSKIKFKKGGTVTLNENDVCHISMRRPDYLQWGEPVWLGAITEIARKERKKNNDEQATSKLVKQILTVTIGDKDLPATKKQLKSIISLFSKAKGAAAFTVIWNHTLKVDFHGPKELAEMINSESYEPLDDSIAVAFGFPLALLGKASSTSYAALAKSIIPVQQKARTARNVILEDFLYPMYDYLHDLNGWERGLIRPVFNSQVLEDPNLLSKRIINYLNGGFVSLKSALSDLPEDYDFDREKHIMTEEFPLREKGIIGPYNSPAAAAVGRPANDQAPTKPDRNKPNSPGSGNKTNKVREVAQKISGLLEENKITEANLALLELFTSDPNNSVVNND